MALVCIQQRFINVYAHDPGFNRQRVIPFKIPHLVNNSLELHRALQHSRRRDQLAWQGRQIRVTEFVRLVSESHMRFVLGHRVFARRQRQTIHGFDHIG